MLCSSCIPLFQPYTGLRSCLLLVFRATVAIADVAIVFYLQRKDEEEERIKSAAKRAQDEAARSTSSVDISVSEDVLETIRKAEEEREKARDKKRGEGGEDKPKFTSEIVSLFAWLTAFGLMPAVHAGLTSQPFIDALLCHLV